MFLSEPDLRVALDAHGRTDVYGPDYEPATQDQVNQLPGIVKLFTRVDPARGAQVNRPLSRLLAQAVEQAGIRESTTHRRVGIYELGELLDEGEGWQDFAAVHPEVRDTHRRIRVYLTGQAHSEARRDALTRAATREFKFLRGLGHPGIARPVELLTTPRGPTLILEHDPGAERLDHWMADRGRDLGLLARIDLVRDLAETLRYAHRHGLYHRSLAPQHIYVSTVRGKAELRIQDWQTASRQAGTTTGGTAGTVHVADRVAGQAQLYLAPETPSRVHGMRNV